MGVNSFNIRILVVFLVQINAVSLVRSNNYSYNATGEKEKTFEGDVSVKNGSVIQMSSHDVITQRIQLWHRRTIPFTISPQFDEAQKKIVLDAMAEIEKDTCITFKQRKKQRDFIHIQLGKSCLSHVGRLGGEQNLTLIASLNPRANCVAHGEVLHELMHAIGFWHEQSRPDRDDYVVIRFNLMRKSASKSNFNKHLNQWDFHLPYDYSSVLHYPKDAFQRFPSSITIIPVIKEAPIGLRNHLSHFDKVKINLLYKCKRRRPRPRNRQS